MKDNMTEIIDRLTNKGLVTKISKESLAKINAEWLREMEPILADLKRKEIESIRHTDKIILK